MSAKKTESWRPRRQFRRRRQLPQVEETSAGGLVLDLREQTPFAAIIARRNRRGRLIWSLPKGHMEGEETPEDTALREIHEETGLRTRILAPLGVVDFWFIAEGKKIHKTVHHFLMEALSFDLDDSDPEVDVVEWVALSTLSKRLSHNDERNLLSQVPSLLTSLAL